LKRAWARRRARALALLSPPALVGLLVFAAGLLSLLVIPLPRPTTPLTRIDLEGSLAAVPEPEEISLVVSDSNNLSRSVPVEVALPQGAEGRLEAVLTALRGYLSEAGPESPDGPLWPQALAAPRVFIVETGARASYVVLDFALAEAPEVSVSQELRLLASIRRTVRLHAGTDKVYFLVDGQPRPSLLGHVALEGALD
jgi:hypothetical protein